MPNFAIVPTFLRELLVKRSLPREPEPDLVMDDEAQVAAYSNAGRIDGVMSAAYLFHSARISQVLQGRKTVMDLGCGPATQLAQIAELNPDIQFVGVDLSATMLESAELHVKQLGLTNVSFRLGDISLLNGFDDASFDAVISTMALHHLPTFQHLESCFHAIRRVLKPDGALYLTDFGRLKSLKSVLFFAYMNADHQPHLFSLDYERSLRAAFLLEEFEQLKERVFTAQTNVFSTFKMPLLVLIKTQDHPLPADLKSKLCVMRNALPARYRRDLDDLRMFFKLGGLPNDPFKN